MGLWLPIGVSIGICFGLAFSSDEDNNEKSSSVRLIYNNSYDILQVY